MYVFGYLVQTPDLLCYDSAGKRLPSTECTSSNICSKDPQISSWEVDWSSERSLDNWWVKLSLMCEPRWKVGAIGSALFLGWCSTLLWIPPLSDLIGRKKVFVVGPVIDFFSYSVIMTTDSLDVMIAAIFIYGATTSIRVNAGWIYFQELMPKHNFTFYSMIGFEVDALIFLCATLYFWLICKTWFYFTMIGYGFTIVGLCLVWFLPESPRLLIS